jgi:UDP-glucose 4-epimerase
LGTGTGFSVLELVKTFESVNNVKVPLQFVNRRAGDIATCYADTHKAFSTLNWMANRNLADMCQSAWQFEKIQRNSKWHDWSSFLCQHK